METLEYPDLLQISNINKKCLEEARKVFKVNFFEAIFFVAGPFGKDEHIGIQIELYYHAHLRTLNAINATLNNFGHLINDIRLNFEDIDENEGREIVKSINERCFESLTTFYLENCKGNVLLDWLKTPFRNVTFLVFSSSQEEELEIKDDQKLNNFFPNTEILRIKHIRSSEWKLFDCSFPELASIYLNFPKEHRQNFINESHISNFLKINPQISNFFLKNANLKVLNEVSKLSPFHYTLEIDGLSDDYLNYQGDTINLKSMFLTIRNIPINLFPERIKFNSLTILTVEYEHNFTSKWIDFIQNQTNSNLSMLTLNFKSIKREQFLEVLSQFTELETIYVYNHDSFTLMADDIINFIAKNKLLNVLELYTRMERPEQIKLRRSIRKQWMMKYTKIFKQIHIER